MPEVAEAPPEVEMDLEETTETTNDAEVDIDPEEKKEETPKRTRRLLAEDNVYVYKPDNPKEIAPGVWGDKEANKTAEKAKNGLDGLSYKPTEGQKEGDKVENFRVFRVSKNAEYNDETGAMEKGQAIACVLAGSSSQAAEIFLKDAGYDLDLHYKMKRGGAGRPKKVETEYLFLGGMLALKIFSELDSGKGTVNLSSIKEDATEQDKKMWEQLFGTGGKLEHYLDKTNPNEAVWKESN